MCVSHFQEKPDRVCTVHPAAESAESTSTSDSKAVALFDTAAGDVIPALWKALP